MRQDRPFHPRMMLVHLYRSQKLFSFASSTSMSEAPPLFQQMNDMSSASKSWTNRHTSHYIQVNLLNYFNGHVLLSSRHDIKSLTSSPLLLPLYSVQGRCEMQGEVQEDAPWLAMCRGYDGMLARNYSCEEGFSLSSVLAHGLKPTTSSSMQTRLAVFGISRDSTSFEKMKFNSFFCYIPYNYIFYPPDPEFNLVWGCLSLAFAQRPRISAVQDDAEQMVAELRQDWEKSAQVFGILENPGKSLGSSTLMED